MKVFFYGYMLLVYLRRFNPRSKRLLHMFILAVLKLQILHLALFSFFNFLCNIALYSIRPCFYHQSHPQLGIVFALAPSLHSFWSYFSTNLQ